MDPAGLIPSPDAIPVHWGWFQFLLTLTFILHILFMNAMLGSGILALVREFRTGTDPDPVSRDISLKLPYTIAFTINLGVAPLLFVQVLFGQFIYTSSVLMAVYWLSVVGLLIVAYYSAYLYDFKFEALGQGGRRIFICLCVSLLLFIAFIFTNNMTLMLRPENWLRYFTNPSGTLLNLSDPMVIPRFLHFITASIAVGGLFQALVWQLKKDRNAQDTEAIVNNGLDWFARATCFQAVWGIWFLVALPPETRSLFLGGSLVHTGLLILGIDCGIAAVIFAVKRLLWPAVAALAGTVFLMIIIREMVRRSFLEPYFSPGDLTVIPEYGPMVLFLVAFAVGLGLIAYMLKLAAAASKEVAQ